MDKKFEYQFDSSLGILFKCYYGLIDIEDIVSSWEYAFENNLIPKQGKGFVLDYRNSNFNIKIEEYTAIVDFYKKHLDIFGGFKIAIITEEARDIVIPILVETKDDGYSSKPFSTLEAATKWVLG
ncbi:hypothetical protein [Maribellus sp. YY47]|uniref:hypothetical protein n=1 Tax=Maribellus sp. YY47 TaxID=2929486 RepID=UPI00200162C0|nr:hypothetical protein [Maribellus sp. YY47]MCK3684091.1 hypothetical protein [Maribellus sp. YY47]